MDAVKTRRVVLSHCNVKCPECGGALHYHSKRTRRVNEIGIGKPTVLHIEYANYRCNKCQHHTCPDMSHIVRKGARFSRRVESIAIDLVINQGLNIYQAARHMAERYYVNARPTTIHDWTMAF